MLETILSTNTTVLAELASEVFAMNCRSHSPSMTAKAQIPSRITISVSDRLRSSFFILPRIAATVSTRMNVWKASA